MYQQPLGILGGTFDPIHNGHLQIAQTLYQDLNLKEIRFIPCKQPVLKNKTHATTADRLAMLKIALAPYQNFIIDTRELDRTTPSYTVETLQSLRQEMPDTPLCLIIGMDAFLDLPQWHQWQTLFTLCHFIIINRNDCKLTDNASLSTLLKNHETNDLSLLNSKLAGYIFQKSIAPIMISSSTIRQQIKTGENVSHLLPKQVWQYIDSKNLYR